MDIRLEILALEQLLLDPEARKNDRLLKQLLAEDFVEFGAVGKSWTKAEVIVGLKSQTWIKGQSRISNCVCLQMVSR